MMKTKMVNVAVLLAMLFFFQNSFSQGTVTGKIRDTNGPLPGANVLIEGTYTGTITNLEGVFSLSNAPVGTRRLEISYIGYEKKYLEFTVSQGEKVNLGEILLTEGIALNDVIIKGVYRPSQVRALSIKKTSVNVAEVLAADAIGKLPDRNAAEAVQRMQGVSIERDMGEGRRVIVRGAPTHWTSILLNGNRLPSAGGASDERYTQLDIFPSELIEYVRLDKAPTPDLDGDAIGGTMNFITKSTPLDETFSVNLAGGYNTRSAHPSYNGSVVYGNRIGEKFGFIASGVIWDRRAGIDRYEVNYDFTNEDPVQAFGINTLQLRDYLARRRTLGFNLGMDYDLSENSRIYFKGLYSQYLDQQTVRETYFNFYQDNIQYQARHADYITNLYSYQLGGDFKLGTRLRLDVLGQYSNSDFRLNSPDILPEEDRGYPIVNFVQPTTYEGLAADGIKYLAMDSPDGTGSTLDDIRPDPTIPVTPSQSMLNQVILASLKKDETQYTGKFDFNYNLNDRLNFKAGGKYALMDREFNSYTLVKMQAGMLGIPGSPPILTMDQLESSAEPFDGNFLKEIGDVYDDINYASITNEQIDELYTDEFAAEHGLITVLDKDAPSNAPASYTGTEEVLSGYFMASLKMNDKVEITGGIRNEVNRIEFSGKRVITTGEGVTIENVVESKNYNAFLPMIHMKYHFSEKAILRAAVTRSYSRPTFNRLNPGTQISEITYTITEGNTKLNPTFSTNYDLMFEYYPEILGLFSAGVYYKGLTDYIYDDQSIVNLDGQNYLLSRPDNLESAWLFGVEVGVVKRFENANNFFKNFGVELNYSYIDSEVEIPTFTGGEQTGSYKTTLPGQAKHIGNAVLIYENNKFSTRLAGNLKGRYISTIRSIAGPEHYRWFDNNFTVDLSSSYDVADNFRIFLEISNLTNAPNSYFHGDPSRPEQRGWSGIRGQLGLNYKL